MKRLLLISLVLLLSFSVNAQYTRDDAPASLSDSGRGQKPPQPYNFWDHVSIGGNFGLQFGQVTFVGLSPLMNYHFNDNFTAGIGPIYQYLNITDPTGYYAPYTSSIYGGRVTATYYLPGNLSYLFVMGECDVINVPDYYSSFANITRATITIPLAGIGTRRPIGANSYLTLAALWDFSNSPLSPYSNPIIIAGIDIGM